MILYKYIRLSDEDGDLRSGEKIESNSVVNQRALLDEYIVGHEEFSRCTCLELCDDGYSGMNFDRPGVQELLSKVRSGEAHIILVKDFSRFGRNYLETGVYLEKVFPLLGVRFVAVNDGYDSAYEKYGTAGNIDVGMKTLINEMYSRDLSVRVKTSRRQYAQRGECVAAYTIYGYMKSPEDRRKLVPDPPAAEIVQRIYALYLGGHTTREICDTMNSKGVLTPMLYKRAAGAKRTTWNSEREENKWSLQAVSKILRDERYTGKLLSHKRERYMPGNPGTKENPTDRWIEVEDAFPPIIDKETFRAAQARHVTRAPKRQGSNAEDNIFSGLLKCGHCGYGLSLSHSKKASYYCQNKGQRRRGERTPCDDVRIGKDELADALLASIRYQARLVAQEDYIEADKKTAAQRKTQLRNVQAEVEKRMNRKADAFRRYNEGQIDRHTYNELCRAANVEIAEINEERERIERDKDDPAIRETHVILQGLDTLPELDRGTLTRLIERVLVFDGERIEICWHFSDPYSEQQKYTDRSESV